MNAPNQGIRKAAILVSSLETKAADALLDQMPPERAYEVRQAIMALDDIDPAEQRQVIDEFFRLGGRPAAGIELDDGLAQKLGLSPAGVPLNRPTTGKQKPFAFLEDAEADKLQRVLAAERPQTIALVLSHLPPRQAGGVLVRLPAVVQADVVRRLVELEETDPEILRDVEAAIETRLAAQVDMQRRRVAGLSAVAGILAACRDGTGEQILDMLRAHDQPLAEQLGPSDFDADYDYDALCELDDAALALVFRTAGESLAQLALIGAEPRLVRRVLRHWPVEAAAALREAIEFPEPVRLSDVDEARQQIAAVAQRLARQGRIGPPPSVALRRAA